MKYIFDFDNTLNDTDRFKADAVGHMDEVTPDIYDIFDASKYLYADVIPFLETLDKNDVRILTAMTPTYGPMACEFQKAKLAKSGVSEYVADIVFMEGLKGPYAQEMYDGTPTVFVDDKLEQLESVKEVCPDMYVVQIVRSELQKEIPVSESKDIPVVTSLAELDTLVESWK